MDNSNSKRYDDLVLLIARILLMTLFLLFGFKKLFGFSGTEAYMAQVGAPAPLLSALIAVFMEVFVGLAILLGFATRPLAIIMLLYTLGTGLIGHHYWTMTGMDQFEAMINFYKNISIMGGLLLLSVTGPGRISVDRFLKFA